MSQTLKLRMVQSKWQNIISQCRAGERRQTSRRNMSFNEASRSREYESGNVRNNSNFGRNPRNYSGDPQKQVRPRRDFSSKTSGRDANNFKPRDKSDYSGKKTQIQLPRKSRFDQSFDRGQPQARYVNSNNSSAYRALAIDSSGRSNNQGQQRNHSTTQQLSRSSYDSRKEEQLDDNGP
jgi:hypothetical protein